MMKAAGDAGRMRILAILLQRGELGVSEIAELSDSDASTTSHRLRLLHSQSLVARRVQGRERLYRLADLHVESLVHNVLDHADRSVSIS